MILKANLHIPNKNRQNKNGNWRKPIKYVKCLPVLYLYTKHWAKSDSKIILPRARAIWRILLFLVTAAILVGVASYKTQLL